MVSEEKNRTETEGQRWPVPVMALVLGALSVIAALAICLLTYFHTINSAEEQLLTYYMEMAQAIAVDAKSHSDLSDHALLELMDNNWNQVDVRPADQYLYVMDADSKLLLHTLYRDTVGNDAGGNQIIGNRECEPCTLSEVIQSRENYLGGYLSSDGQHQIAAFVHVPSRGWTIGVHRSRKALRDEIRAGLNPLLAALMIVCGLLIPVSLFLLYRTFRVVQARQKRIENERRELLVMLDAKNKELQSLVYISSHDLKTPLVNIAGFSGMLKDHCREIKEVLAGVTLNDEVREKLQLLLDEDIREDLDFIRAGVKQVQALLDGLLRVSRVGTAEIMPQRINMNHVLSEILDMVRFRCEEKQAAITVDPLPECICDLNQVHQIFTNLLDNALKYLDPQRKGQIHVSGTVQGPKVVYCVQDNGIGIEERYQHKIFDIYYRLDPTGQVEGEGLGLVIIRRILDRHSGKIWLESEFGKGSKFYVSLPYKESL